MKKATFYTEPAYLLGLTLLALGTALMEAADFGVSMVVAPAYLLYLKLRPLLPFFSFGMAEYSLQFLLLALLCLILHRVKPAYIFSFVTAMLYALLLDEAMRIISLLPVQSTVLRLLWYLTGMTTCSAGVSLLFHSYISPEVYELFVKELARKTGMAVHRLKTLYDLCSCALAIALSFCFFGFGVFEGVKLGTIFCALANGSLIGFCSKIWDARFVFRDALKLRAFFEK